MCAVSRMTPEEMWAWVLDDKGDDETDSGGSEED